ncbi:NUDIX domain-containing protein [Desulfovibrio cuneatus]|uniref:NUDIX domain-containing protein n=1 Tax=Desulfovibrio cuneatus TaxID=159728 RepID=UPI0003F8D520|nr:NUDIX hydrolase [Desulfovibrio cuneatus]
MHGDMVCPHCGSAVLVRRNPAPTVDVVLYCPVRGVVLVQRKNPPHGWALPGGFIDYGEAAETAAVREAKEETGLDVCLVGLLGVYSDPQRDPRGHTMSVVYVGKVASSQTAKSHPGHVLGLEALHPSKSTPPLFPATFHGPEPVGADDALEAHFFPLHALPTPLAFDHQQILADFATWLEGKPWVSALI